MHPVFVALAADDCAVAIPRTLFDGPDDGVSRWTR